MFPSESKIAASYQWSKRSTPGNPRTIAPGALRKYAKPRNLEFSLKRDHDAPIVDENKDKMSPFSSAVPLLHAIGACSPELNMGTIDIVTDRNNLRNLMLFCGSPRCVFFIHRCANRHYTRTCQSNKARRSSYNSSASCE